MLRPGQSSSQQLPRPYVGLRPFERTPEDQARFFGRDQEARRIISMILSHPVTLVYSQSGAGKTSLFNAKILPSLKEYEFQILPSVRVKAVLPVNEIPTNVRNIYVFNVLQALCPDASPLTLAEKTLPVFLREYPRSTKVDGDMAPRIIIFDQLEELFNLFPEGYQEQQKDFFKQIAQALEEDPLLRIVFVIREEYLARLDPFAALLPDRMRARFRLEGLRRESALLAVEGPLQKMGFHLPEGVPEKIVDNLRTIHVENLMGQSEEVKGEYVEPVQLQIVCQKLWSEGLPEKVTEEGLGDVDKALEDFYVDAIREASKKTKTKEEIIRRWFEEKLITSSGTRSVVHRGFESTGGLSNRVVNVLENKYLVRKEERSGAQWYELTHDRLIKPIKDSNKKWYEQRRKSRNSLFIRVILPVSIVVIIGIYFLVSYTYAHYVTLPSLIQSGKSQEDADNYTAAIESYDKALGIDPNTSTALSGIGEVYVYTGDYGKANTLFNRALAISKNDPNALIGKGEVLSHWGYYGKANTLFNRALAISKNDPNALIGIGEVFVYTGDYGKANTLFNRALAIDRNSTHTFDKVGDALVILGNYIGANSSFSKAYAINKNDPNALSGIGEVRLATYGDYIGANSSFSKAYAIDPKNINALDGIGDVLVRKGTIDNNNTESKIYYKRALDYYLLALSVDKNNTRVLYDKGISLEKLYRTEASISLEKLYRTEALVTFDEVLKINRNDTHAQFEACILHNSTVEYCDLQYYKRIPNSTYAYTGALQYYNKILAVNPKNSYIQSNFADALVRSGNYTGALQYYNKILAIYPNDRSALQGKGLILLNLHNNTGALQYFGKAVHSYDNSLAFYTSTINNKANFLYFLGNYTQANQLYQQVLAINPNDSKTLTNIGNALIALGNYTEGIKYTKKALDVDRKNIFALNNLGDALIRSGNYTGAISESNKALVIDPYDGYGLVSIGVSLDNLGDSKGAIKYFNKALDSSGGMGGYFDNALSRNSVDVDAMDGKGEALAGERNYTGALHYYDEALSINQKNLRVLDDKAVSLNKLGNRTEAVYYFDKALSINPKDKFALDNLNRIKSGKREPPIWEKSHDLLEFEEPEQVVSNHQILFWSYSPRHL